jgi:hypothetical protein
MFSFTQTPARALAAATLLGSIVLAGPFAIAANHAGVPAAIQLGSTRETLAQASTAPATTESAPAGEKSDPVEARIKELHSRLHITAAQQSQWDKLVPSDARQCESDGRSASAEKTGRQRDDRRRRGQILSGGHRGA